MRNSKRTLGVVLLLSLLLAASSVLAADRGDASRTRAVRSVTATPQIQTPGLLGASRGLGDRLLQLLRSLVKSDGSDPVSPVYGTNGLSDGPDPIDGKEDPGAGSSKPPTEEHTPDDGSAQQQFPADTSTGLQLR